MSKRRSGPSNVHIAKCVCLSLEQFGKRTDTFFKECLTKLNDAATTQTVQEFLNKVRVHRMRGQVEELYAEVVKELNDPMDATEEAMKKLLKMSLSKCYVKADSKSDFLDIFCNSNFDVESVLEPFTSIVISPTAPQHRNRMTPPEMLKAFKDGSIIENVDINTIYVLKDRLNYGIPTTSSVKDW